MRDVAEAKDNLLKQSEKEIKEERIAFLVENSYDYVGAQDLPFPSTYIYLEYGIAILNWSSMADFEIVQ